MDEAPACVIRGLCLSADWLCQPSFEIQVSTPGAYGRMSSRDCDASIKFVLNSSTLYYANL